MATLDTGSERSGSGDSKGNDGRVRNEEKGPKECDGATLFDAFVGKTSVKAAQARGSQRRANIIIGCMRTSGFELPLHKVMTARRHSHGPIAIPHTCTI